MLTRLSSSLASSAAPLLFVWIAFLAILDYKSSLQAPLSLFYALATTMAGYFCSPGVAFAGCVWAFTLHVIGNPPRGWEVVDDGFRLILWMSSAFVGKRLRDRYEELKARTEELAYSRQRMLLHLEQARHVQQKLMRTTLPTDDRLEISWELQVAASIGGDYLHLRRDADWLHILAADVSGKGPSAALITAILHAMVEELRKAPRSCSQLLHLLNQRLCEVLPGEMFITCFVARWNLSTGELAYANAGHEGPLLFHRKPGCVVPLYTTGLPLGVLQDEEFDEITLSTRRGDILLVYTDGLTDSLDEHGSRLDSASVESELFRWGDAPTEEILRRLKSLSPDLKEGRLTDDLLLLAARRTR